MVCLSNIRQVGSCWLLYSLDNKGVFPDHRGNVPFTLCANTSVPAPGWVPGGVWSNYYPVDTKALILPYVQTYVVMYCPDFVNIYYGYMTDEDCWNGTSPPGDGQIFAGYSIGAGYRRANPALLGDLYYRQSDGSYITSPGDNPSFPLSTKDIVQPSDSIIASDLLSSAPYMNDGTAATPWFHTHPHVYNVLCGDGHAEVRRLADALVQFQTDPSFTGGLYFW